MTTDTVGKVSIVYFSSGQLKTMNRFWAIAFNWRVTTYSLFRVSGMSRINPILLLTKILNACRLYPLSRNSCSSAFRTIPNSSAAPAHQGPSINERRIIIQSNGTYKVRERNSTHLCPHQFPPVAIHRSTVGWSFGISSLFWISDKDMISVYRHKLASHHPHRTTDSDGREIGCEYFDLIQPPMISQCSVRSGHRTCCAPASNTNINSHTTLSMPQ